jgi:predicted ester cyclase
VKATVEDMVAEGDKVAFRLTWHGTKDGKPVVTASSISITRLLPNGKMVEVRDAYVSAS